MRIRTIRPGEEAAWNGFVAAHADGTFFHRAEWAGVLARAFAHRPHYLLAEQDGAITGVLPLARQRSVLFGHAMVSVPFCVYGGVLAADPPVAEALLAAAAAEQDRTGAASLELRPRVPALLDPAVWQAREGLYATFRRQIGTDDDANLKAVPRKQRAVIRKTLEGSLAVHTDQDVDTAWRVYAESVRNLGTPVFPRRYFRLLLEAFGEALSVTRVMDGSTVHAAVVNFHWRDEVLPYYGGGTSAARASHAYDRMYWEVMRAAAARGARMFDFGRSKAGTGAYAFKKNWGFTPQPLTQYFRLRPGEAIPEHNPLNPKYRLFIAAWKKLPLPLANRLGPFVVRGVG